MKTVFPPQTKFAGGIKNSSRNTISVSNGLDSDQDQNFVGPDLGLNYLKRLSTDDIICCKQGRVKAKKHWQSPNIYLSKNIKSSGII